MTSILVHTLRGSFEHLIAVKVLKLLFFLMLQLCCHQSPKRGRLKVHLGSPLWVLVLMMIAIERLMRSYEL